MMRDLVALADELAGEVATDLAGADDDHVHDVTSQRKGVGCEGRRIGRL